MSLPDRSHRIFDCPTTDETHIRPQADATGLTAARVAEILRHVTRLPIIMIGLAACVFFRVIEFSGDLCGVAPPVARSLLRDLHVDDRLRRFTLAQAISRLPVRKLAFTLFAMTLVALVLFVSNPGSEILYVIDSFVFAIGYGLSYSTLNGMAVNLASERACPHQQARKSSRSPTSRACSDFRMSPVYW